MSISNWVKGFHDVTILASNVDELRRFYGKLGFPQVVSQGDELAVFVVGDNELAIHTSRAKPSEAIVLSLRVSNIEDIQQGMSNLGIKFDGPVPMRPGLVGIAIRDPNGNKLEFLAPANG